MSLMPKDQGLYEARREHDACGIGAVVNISGKKDHSIIQYAKQILLNLHHRGAAGADNVTGDGKTYRHVDRVSGLAEHLF